MKTRFIILSLVAVLAIGTAAAQRREFKFQSEFRPASGNGLVCNANITVSVGDNPHSFGFDVFTTISNARYMYQGKAYGPSDPAFNRMGPNSYFTELGVASCEVGVQYQNNPVVWVKVPISMTHGYGYIDYKGGPLGVPMNPNRLHENEIADGAASQIRVTGVRNCVTSPYSGVESAIEYYQKQQQTGAQTGTGSGTSSSQQQTAGQSGTQSGSGRGTGTGTQTGTQQQGDPEQSFGNYMANQSTQQAYRDGGDIVVRDKQTGREISRMSGAEWNKANSDHYSAVAAARKAESERKMAEYTARRDAQVRAAEQIGNQVLSLGMLVYGQFQQNRAAREAREEAERLARKEAEALAAAEAERQRIEMAMHDPDLAAAEGERKYSESRYAEALEWYGRAIDMGSPDGMFWMGVMYSKGRGVAQDDVEAAEWYAKAIENGFPSERMPQFEGGDTSEFVNWTNGHIVYPALAQELNITGTVIVTFVLDIDGTMISVSPDEEADKVLAAEAVRVVKSSPRWSPGIMNGSPIKVSYQVPVVFELVKRRRR